MRTSVLFGAKTSDLSKFVVCPHRQGGGSIFRDFARTSLASNRFLYRIEIFEF